MCDKIVKIKIVLRSQIRSQGFQEQRPSCATRREQVFTYKTKYVHVTCMQKGSTLLLEQRVASKKYCSSLGWFGYKWPRTAALTKNSFY